MKKGTTMNQARYGLGLLIGVALMLAATAVLAPSAAAQEGTTGSIVIYAYACPPGFTGEDYDPCRATPLAGVSYTAAAAGQDNGVGATTDADGVASLSLSALGGGTINVAMTPPAGYESAFIACSQQYGAIESGITFADLAADAFVTCEWYFVPTSGDPGGDPGAGEDGSLTIQKYACPKGWDGKDDDTCRAHPQAGVGFTVFAAGTDNGVGGTTDGNGVASFPLFAADLPGDIGVSEEMPAGYDAFDVQCTDANGEPVNYVPGDTGITLLGVEDGAEIACEWFNLPAGSADPTPAPSASPKPSATPRPSVGRLPNTGTGVAAGTAGPGLLPLLLAGGFATIALVAVGRRRRT